MTYINHTKKTLISELFPADQRGTVPRIVL